MYLTTFEEVILTTLPDGYFNWIVHWSMQPFDLCIAMLKHCREYFTKIKYEAHGRDGNKVRGEAECFITIEAKRRVLYFS